MFKLTEEKKKELKEKHGDIYLVTVEDKSAVLRKPTRKDLSYAMAASSQGNDPIALAETIMKNCFVEGDRELMEDDDYFFGAMPVVTEMIQVKAGELKKL